MPWFPEAAPDGKLAKAFVDEWKKRGHPFAGLTEGFRGHDGIATIAEAVRDQLKTAAGAGETAAEEDAQPRHLLVKTAMIGSWNTRFTRWTRHSAAS